MDNVQSSRFAARMRIYFDEMYPIPQRLFFAAIFSISFLSFLAAIHNLPSPLFTPYTLVAIWAVFSFMLILRLMDELKDREIDRQLFAQRPLPSGRVRESDIVTSLTSVILLFLLAHLWIPRVLWITLILLGYSLLMFKYFFIPLILCKYLLLNLLTHNPVTAILLTYLVVLFATEQGVPLSRLDWPHIMILILMYWSVLFAWEISRKIRAPEEETAYVTYSQILGPRGAVALVLGAQTVAFILGMYFYRTLPLSWVFPLILTSGYVRIVLAYLRFLAHPSSTTSKLRPVAEQYGICLFAAQILSAILPL
nr:UbiA family prenyltransferase [uncultured Desulfobulbus sp.]